MPSLRFPTNETIQDEVAGKWFPYGVGIDCHSLMVWACVLEPVYQTGKQKRELVKFETDPKGLRGLRGWLEERVPAQHRRVLVESTSTYHFPILRALPGWTAIVINPMLVGSAKRKTDRWDAQALAHHCMAGTFPAYVLPTDAEHAFRATYRRWAKIGHAVVRMTNAIRSRMCLFGVNYQFNVRSGVGYKVFRSMCVGVPAPRHLICTQAMWHAVEFDDRVREIPPLVRELNRLQLEEIDLLQAERIKVFALLLEAAPLGRIELLISVPFVKHVLAACYLAEIGFDQKRRFPNIKSIVAYAGFDPSKRVSADNVTSHMPSCGSKYLRHSVLQVAAAVMMSKHPLGRYGRDIAEKVGKRGWHAGRNAIGRKLIRWMSSVHTTGRIFMEGYVHGQKDCPGQGDADEWCPGGDPGLDCGITAFAGWDGSGPTQDQGDWCEGSVGDVASGDPWQDGPDSIGDCEW